MFDNLSSLVGATFYSLFPYHLYDIYQRGSVGEVLALSILPFILWQIERKSLLWVPIGIALLIMAHNTLAVLFMFLILPYLLLRMFISENKKTEIRFSLITLILGFGLSSFFWIPALFDLQYTVFAKTQISNVNNYFADFGLVGVAAVFIIVAAIALMLSQKIQIKKHKLTFAMLILSIVSIFLSSPISSFIWKILPSSFVQFPFRFLSLTIPSVAFLSACLVSVFSPKKKIVVSLIVIVLVFLSAISYLTPKTYQTFPDSFYTTNQDTTTVKNEYMPKWATKIPLKMPLTKVDNLYGKEAINLSKATPSVIEFSVFLASKSVIQVNTIYFPGWYAYIDGKEAKILYNNPMGLINLNLNKGVNNVQVVFKETPIRLFADLISLISAVGLLSLFLLRKKI